MAAPALVANPPPASQRSLPSLGQRAGKLDWLDALKGIAILAVVADHAFIVSDYLVWKHLYFAVSWFIFLAGVSNTFSARRRNFEPKRDSAEYLRRRAASVLPTYLGASVFAYVTIYLGRASNGDFLHQFLGLHTLPPLYFIPLLFQFLLAFPILFFLIYRSGWRGRLLVAGLTVPIAAVLGPRMTFGWPLGAHYFLGASFLYLFLLGMVAEPFLTSDRLATIPLLCVSVLAFAGAEWGNVSTGGLLMTHPPSNLLVLYAVSLLGVAYALCRLFPGSLPVRGAVWLGRRSLSIFMYHYPFLIPIFAYRHVAWTSGLPLGWLQLAVMAIAIPVAVIGAVLAARAMEMCGVLLLRLLHRARHTETGKPLYTVADRKGL